MIINKINSYYLINSIKEHDKIKKELLSLIDKIPVSNFSTVHHTDWNLPKDFKREYLDLFINTIKPYLEKITNFFKGKECIIHNVWFQQYIKNSHHTWHRHPKSNFTNVYYLELPNNNATTVLLDENDKEINIKAEEGDLVTFPAHILHKSNVIEDNNRKTVIAFNCCYY